MANLAPPLSLLLQVRQSLENGQSCQSGVRKYLGSHPDDDFFPIVLQWFSLAEQGLSTSKIKSHLRSPYRFTLLTLLENGISGKPILKPLRSFESELVEACKLEIESDLTALPFKILIPLLLFQFPAFLLLLLGPLFIQFMKI